MSPTGTSANVPTLHGDAVKARPGREKTKWWCHQDSNLPVSTLRFRFLALVVFSVLSSKFSEHCQKIASVNGHQSQKQYFGRQSSTFCVWKTGKEGKNACWGTPRASLSQRAAEHPMHWVKKQGSCTGTCSRGKHRQSKPKEGEVEVRDLRGILVRSSQGKSQAVRRSIYIYREWRKAKSTRNSGARWGSPKKKKKKNQMNGLSKFSLL